MNYNNLAQRTNWTAGSDQFKEIPFFLTVVNVPGITFSNPTIGGRNSARINLAADTVTFNPLTFDMLVDEDLVIYREIMAIIRKNIKVPDGTFEDFCFDFWIELNNNKGHNIMKLEFFNCRLTSISDIILDAQDESTEYLVSVEMSYDYFEMVENDRPTLRT